MKIYVGKNDEIVLEEVFSGILLRSPEGEEIGICMRDSGFEFSYSGEWHEAKGGVVAKMKKPLFDSEPNSATMPQTPGKRQ